MSDFEIEVLGSPSPEEERAIRRAIKELLQAERKETLPSPWKMSGRAASTRNGIIDYRNRLGREAWSATERMPWVGQLYNGRHGRGDAK